MAYGFDLLGRMAGIIIAVRRRSFTTRTLCRSADRSNGFLWRGQCSRAILFFPWKCPHDLMIILIFDVGSSLEN